jgi:galactofuranosylgalactofuranosylrhamnosyl-N-acetylglucosaminyl-diphospho-decaprenol beta-1,5/1,6-galactofuranosyltransferase
LESVVLRVELTGSGRVDVYRTKATGSRITVGGASFSGTTDDPDGSDSGGPRARGTAPLAEPAVVEFEVGLDPFEDGGWIWFDITTDIDVGVHSAGWYAAVPAPGRADIAVGIPTFNRPADCVNALATLTSDPLVDAAIGAVIVTDQGTRKVVDHPDFVAAAAPLGDRLSIHNQPNLGGSGGYSRVMYEALKNTDCQQILFMDDDIRIEPDSILRALALNRFAKAPTLIGGQMLNLQEPSHLHVMGEVVDRANFMWTHAPYTEYDHDFAKYPLSDDEDRSQLLHRRIDVDYNGWWMCMIPRQVAEELGQPLPLFIKWDDADYGLRAGEHGYGTVTMPGTAIWHMAWSDKDDAIDWQAYFHLRNRLVVAALHWDGDVKGLIASHLKATLKHLLCLEYSTVAIQNRAIDDFLAGPEHIFSVLESALPEVHALRTAYPDAVVLPGATSLPTPSGRKKAHKPPVKLPAIGYRLLRGVVHQLQKEDPAHHSRPELNVATQDARWFLLCNVDGVTVTTADGRGVVYRQRDRAKMFELLRSSLRRQAALARKFNTMRRVYRAALPMLTSTQRWETVLLEQNSISSDA